MIERLYPPPHEALPLPGLYLALGLQRQAVAGDLLIYANFIASLDGRIALRSRESGGFAVPAAIANGRDWRLYQELAAQSDVMITSARYFRQLAEGTAQDLLPVADDPRYANIAQWRREQGLPAQPDIAIVSNSLDIPLPGLERLAERRLFVLTSEQAEGGAAERLRQQGIDVVPTGATRVEGKLLRRVLIERGYRAAYMIAGPEVHRTLIDDGALDELFLTTRHTLLGGGEYRTILEGEVGRPRSMELLSLWYDAAGGQTFAHYRVGGEAE